MKIIAHRGFSALYPENTLLAFSKALEAGVDGIETDLRLSRDGHAMIFHDDTLKRMTGHKAAVESLTLAELKALNIGAAQSIPTLEELLRLTSSKATLILEIKYVDSTFKKLCDVIENRIKDKLDWVEVSCFDDKVLEYMHHLNPHIRLHKLIDKPSVIEDKEFEKRYHYVSYFDIDVRLKACVVQHGLLEKYKVIFWTVDKEDITKEKEAGLYGIMKNNPTL